jgi:hypothetical protein
MHFPLDKPRGAAHSPVARETVLAILRALSKIA